MVKSDFLHTNICTKLQLRSVTHVIDPCPWTSSFTTIRIVYKHFLWKGDVLQVLSYCCGS
jgi:hypothetical protein